MKLSTFLLTFLSCLLSSILLTPFFRRLGIRLGALDYPKERKIHLEPIPRIGGLSIFSSFYLGLLFTFLIDDNLSKTLIWDTKIHYFLFGALVGFGAGLFDDFRSIGSGTKLALQILAASIAFWGGIRIESLLGYSLHHPALEYLLTILWFILFINAINLIDGLDGLAAGITLLLCLTIGYFSFSREQYIIAGGFFALGGAVLGFLRYNFNPASIFMGDGGSYFIGYTIAALSIMGASKIETGAVLLIPLLALGIPVFDTILSPLRRFIFGQKIFQADRSHIHHRLIELGFSTRKAVFLIYGISLGLCVFSIILVNLRNETIGIFLIILLLAAFFMVKKLRYFEYFAWDKIYGWVRDITDEAGLNRERRTFLNLQERIIGSKNLEEIWENAVIAIHKLGFNLAELHLNKERKASSSPPTQDCHQTQGYRDHIEHSGDKNHAPWVWARPNELSHPIESQNEVLRIELPLINNENHSFGKLHLIKDLKREPMDYYTLRRVESLRRAIIRAIDQRAKNA